jgi:hypothetical protein
MRKTFLLPPPTELCGSFDNASMNLIHADFEPMRTREAVAGPMSGHGCNSMVSPFKGSHNE